MKQKIYIILIAIFVMTSTSAYSIPLIQQKSLDIKSFTNVFFSGFFGETDDEKRKRLEAERLKKNPPITDKKSFLRSTKIFYEKPFFLDQLEFEIRLPTTWRNIPIGNQESAEFSMKVMSDIAKFIGPILREERPIIRIQARNLTHEIDAAYWAKKYFLKNGYTIQGDIIVENKKSINAYYIHLYKGVVSYVYTRIIFQGDIVIIAKFEIPLNYKDKFEYVQKASIDSLKFITPSKKKIEGVKNFAILDALKLNYPQSWKVVNPDFKNPDRLKIEIHNHDSAKNVTGIMYIVSSKKKDDNTLRSELKLVRELLNLYGIMDIEGLIASHDIENKPRFDFNKMEEYKINFKQDSRLVKQELWLTILSDDEWYVFAFMLSPRYEQNSYQWARNYKGYRNIISSLQ